MATTYFPLRWESTGDQWWYASPIDCAAANGQYDLVRELLRIDNNHLFKLTSLRRIRRLEVVWDDEQEEEQQLSDVAIAKCRSDVAQKLLHESKRGSKKNSLIRAGYGGWLMYTAASAGDLSFVKQLLERDPLLVFGEGEYNVTDIFYAASRGKSSEVFRMVFDFAVSPRFVVSGKGGVLEENVGEVPSVYKWEMSNRAVHAASRGGCVEILEEFLGNCDDVLAYRDAQGSTVLHSAAGRGKVEVVKYLISSFDIINSTDHQGNTALHVAAYRGQLAAVEALVSASPALISLQNNAGETFLHKAVSGFQSTSFRRLDKQVELLRKLVSDKKFHIEEVINVKNCDGRTALHIATIGKIHTDLVKLLMTAPSIDVNVSDAVNGMTPLDYLKKSPNSAASNVLIRKLIAAGGMFHQHHHHHHHHHSSSRKAIASHMKMHSIGGSPGTSFRISDTQIFLYTGIENASDAAASTESDQGSAGMSSSSSEHTAYDSTASKRRPSVAAGLRRVLQWPLAKDKRSEGMRKSVDEASVDIITTDEKIPTPLRQKFFRHSALPNNKRNLSVRSYQSSPNAKKRFASVKVSRRSSSSSFSISSFSSPRSMDKQKGSSCVDNNDGAGPSCSTHQNDNNNNNKSTSSWKRASVGKKLRGPYFCFSKASVDKEEQGSHCYKDHDVFVSGLIG